MDKSLLTEVKAILKSLVLSSPEKITIEQLNRDYRDVEGQFIPYRQLGYGNLEQFLRSVPDTLRVFGTGPTAMVCFVANEKSDHIHNMIMKQKKPKSRSRRRSSNRNFNKAFPTNNRADRNTRQPPKAVGQQLSAFQSVNRNHMTKTIQVKNVNHLVQPVKHVPILNNYNNQLLYNLPQPDGILGNYPQFGPVLSTVKNGIIKAVSSNQVEAYDKEISKFCAYMKRQCNVAIPAPLPRAQQIRTIRFSSEKLCAQEVTNTSKQLIREKPTSDLSSSEYSVTNPVPLPASQQNKSIGCSPEKSAVQDVADTKIESLKKKPTNVSNSIEYSLRETPVYPIEEKAPPVKAQTSVKFSEDESLLTMPKLSKSGNLLECSSAIVSDRNVHNKDSTSSVTAVGASKTTHPKTFFDDSLEKDEDPDEAVPSFAAKNNVFRLDFPENTVSYGNKLPPNKLPNEITVGSNIKVFISEIHNPFKFWFHIYKDNDELDLLMYQMELYYSTLDYEDLAIPMVCLTPGQVCAACYNGLWHRAEIVAPPVYKKIKVSFMDYGTVTEVKIENIKFLQSYFAQLPAQALRGCLSHIKPRDFHWCHEATTYFLTLVAELMLYAKITEIDRKNNVLYMILCDTNGDEVVQINTSLVENQYASFNEEWKTERIKQNNGKRIRHPREDFPTFSMIELGEYPSFNELVSLKQRNIDYEAIYDIIIYNQSTILNKHENASEGLRNLPYFLTTSNPFRSEVLLELYATTSKTI